MKSRAARRSSFISFCAELTKTRSFPLIAAPPE
jgi:hypothetical protein